MGARSVTALMTLPALRAHLRCRYGCAAPARWLVELPDGGVYHDDRLMALCEQHAEKETETSRPRSRFVARITPPGTGRRATLAPGDAA